MPLRGKKKRIFNFDSCSIKQKVHFKKCYNYLNELNEVMTKLIIIGNPVIITINALYIIIIIIINY